METTVRKLTTTSIYELKDEERIDMNMILYVYNK